MVSLRRHIAAAIAVIFSAALFWITSTSAGIKLVDETRQMGDFDNSCFIDFKDFAVLASAWLTKHEDADWNPHCDISEPNDGIIDELDLKILCGNWLNTYITDLIQPGATLKEVYSATGINFEGPTWDPNSDKLFFTRRTGTYQILRLDSPGSVTVWLTPSPQTNGTIMSLDGRLLCCDENPKQISSRRIDPNGPGDTLILADSSDGFTQPPNDLCQLENGNIYFTTPTWNYMVPPSAQGVWLLEPDGTVSMVNNTIYQPNGIITSLDETKLYVSAGSTTPAYQQWWVFDINPDGTLSAGSAFFDPASPPNTSNVPDGITIDELGNLYFTGLGGVWIVSPAGKLLDYISLPNPPFNIAFGGTDGRTLYMTCKNKVYSLAMCVRGGELNTW